MDSLNCSIFIQSIISFTQKISYLTPSKPCLTILIHTTIFDWKKFKRLAEDVHLKIYLDKERSGGEFNISRSNIWGAIIFGDDNRQEEVFEVYLRDY